MDTLRPLNAIDVFEADMVPKGKVFLMKGTVVVWVCDLTDPFEDVDFDGITVHPDDLEELKAAFCGHK